MPRVQLDDGRTVVPLSEASGGVLAIASVAYDLLFPYVGTDLLAAWEAIWDPGYIGPA